MTPYSTTLPTETGYYWAYVDEFQHGQQWRYWKMVEVFADNTGKLFVKDFDIYGGSFSNLPLTNWKWWSEKLVEPADPYQTEDAAHEQSATA